MKYKNIVSAIHNFGHSFLSDMNYVDSEFVVDELRKLTRNGHNITINWKTKDFSPKKLATERIEKAIEFWHSNINKHFENHKIDFARLVRFELIWNTGEDPKVLAIDDRGKQYEKFIVNTF